MTEERTKSNITISFETTGMTVEQVQSILDSVHRTLVPHLVPYRLPNGDRRIPVFEGSMFEPMGCKL